MSVWRPACRTAGQTQDSSTASLQDSPSTFPKFGLTIRTQMLSENLPTDIFSPFQSQLVGFLHVSRFVLDRSLFLLRGVGSPQAVRFKLRGSEKANFIWLRGQHLIC